MTQLSRRSLIGAGLAAAALPLSGCGTIVLNDVRRAAGVRRLLNVAARRAYAGLLRVDGFYADPVARVTLPAELGGTGAISLLPAYLQSAEVREQLLRLVNQAAGFAASAAAPMLLQAIRNLPVGDPLLILRSGSNGAVDYLQRVIGDAVIPYMLPEAGRILAENGGPVLRQALAVAERYDLATLRNDVAAKAAQGVFRAIGREEALLRQTPSLTGDPLLEEIFRSVRTSRIGDVVP